MPVREAACVQRIGKGKRCPYSRGRADGEEVAHDYLPEEASDEEGDGRTSVDSATKDEVAELGLGASVRLEQVEDGVDAA